MSAPFFLKRHETIREILRQKTFLLAVPLMNISSPEHRDFGIIFVIFNPGGYLRKRSNARGKLTKMSVMNPMMLL